MLATLWYLIINFIESNNFIEINNIIIRIKFIIMKLKHFGNYRVDIGSFLMMFYGESQYQRHLNSASNKPNNKNYFEQSVGHNEPVNEENGSDNCCHGTNQCGVDGNISFVVVVLIWWHPPRCDCIPMTTASFMNQIPVDRLFFFHYHTKFIKRHWKYNISLQILHIHDTYLCNAKSAQIPEEVTTER